MICFSLFQTHIQCSHTILVVSPSPEIKNKRLNEWTITLCSLFAEDGEQVLVEDQIEVREMALDEAD